MKYWDRVTSLFVLLLLGAVTGLAGCATTGIERSAKATSTMRAVEADFRQVPVQVDATSAALNELIRPGQVDVKRAYDNYAEKVSAMQKLGNKLDAHSAEMKARGRDYFEEWEKQGGSYSNPQIRELSEQRRADLSQAYSHVSEASIGARASLDAYLADLKEIQSYLSNDLTPKGLQAISPVARTAMQDGDKLKDSVQPVLAAIDAAKSEMARGGAPLPAPETPAYRGGAPLPAPEAPAYQGVAPLPVPETTDSGRQPMM
jgi:hypothetical protein